MSASSESYLAHTNPYIFITDINIKGTMPTANKPAAKKSQSFIAHNRKNKPQSFNQKFSARIASAVKRVESLSRKLQLTQAMLGDFLADSLLENQEVNYILGEYQSQVSYDVQAAINRLDQLAKTLRDYNKGKTSL